MISSAECTTNCPLKASQSLERKVMRTLKLVVVMFLLNLCVPALTLFLGRDTSVVNPVVQNPLATIDNVTTT